MVKSNHKLLPLARKAGRSRVIQYNNEQYEGWCLDDACEVASTHSGVMIEAHRTISGTTQLMTYEGDSWSDGNEPIPADFPFSRAVIIK